MEWDFLLVYTLFGALIALTVLLASIEQQGSFRQSVKTALIVMSVAFVIAFGVLIRDHPYSSATPAHPISTPVQQ